MGNKSNSEIIARVLEMSKSDIYIWDVLSEFDSKQEEEILDFYRWEHWRIWNISQYRTNSYCWKIEIENSVCYS